jgi:hypothetical protein
VAPYGWIRADIPEYLTYCLHLQGRRATTEATDTSEMLVLIYKIPRQHMPEDHNLENSPPWTSQISSTLWIASSFNVLFSDAVSTAKIKQPHCWVSKFLDWGCFILYAYPSMWLRSSIELWKTTVRLIGGRAKIWTEYLWNTRLDIFSPHRTVLMMAIHDTP